MKNPLSFEAFADWCDKQPADMEYDWGKIDGTCAVSQYFTWLGVEEERSPITVKFQMEASGRPWTFGALAARLREASKAGAQS